MKLYAVAFTLLITGFTKTYSQDTFASEPAGSHVSRTSQFERYFVEELVSKVPGAALVIIEGNQISTVRAYGNRSIASNDKVTPDTVFRLASVSKTFASAATAKLVSKSRLSWETPITTELGHLRFKNDDYGKQITLKNILSQSTGLMPHAYTNLIEDNVSYPKILGRLHKVDFVCPPGQCYSYQNVVYSLVGDLVEAKTNSSYEQYVTEHLFEPLDMRQASFGLKAFLGSENFATPHIKKKKQWVPVNKISKSYYAIAPAAGVNASIKDLAKWMQAQLGQRTDVLPEQTLDELHSRITRTSRSQAHYGKRDRLGQAFYGLGWRVFDYDGKSGFVHHGGWVQGMRAEMIFNKDLQIGMAFLTNSEANDLGDVVFKFLEIYVADEPVITASINETITDIDPLIISKTFLKTPLP